MIHNTDKVIILQNGRPNTFHGKFFIRFGTPQLRLSWNRTTWETASARSIAAVSMQNQQSDGYYQTIVEQISAFFGQKTIFGIKAEHCFQ